MAEGRNVITASPMRMAQSPAWLSALQPPRRLPQLFAMRRQHSYQHQQQHRAWGGSTCQCSGCCSSSTTSTIRYSTAASTRGAIFAAPSPVKGLLGRRGGGPPATNAVLTILSQAVGYTIIAGSMLYKVPQVLRIFRKKSAEGISASMFTLETIGTSMSLLYSIRNAFPFSTYGEAFFILAQNVAILTGISVFDKNPSPPVLAFSLILGVGLCALFLSPAMPMAYVAILQTLSIPLLNFSRIPQIIMNHQRKSTGELAPSTLIMQAAGNLARIFTTLVQVQNKLFLVATLVAMAFNGILCYQYFLYRKPVAATQ